MSNLKTKTDTLKVYHVIEPKDDYEYVITNYAFHAKICATHMISMVKGLAVN